MVLLEIINFNDINDSNQLIILAQKYCDQETSIIEYIINWNLTINNLFQKLIIRIIFLNN